MNSLRPELHIAQQSRRDKLRIQQDFYGNNFPNDALNNICYDPIPSDLCSEMINFSANPLLTQDPHKQPPQHYFTTWKTIASQSDWVPNHSSVYPISPLDIKPNYLGYDHHQELHSSLNTSDMNVAPSFYQNALQELVTSSNNVRSFGPEFASLRQKSSGHGAWVVGGSELLLLPDQMRLKTQWSGDLQFAAPKDDHSNTQALSLSLSSVPSPKVHETQIADTDFQDSRTWKPDQNMSTGTASRVLGAQALTHRNSGPLGPFTGYATILRSSRFLRPAQELLEEICCIAAPKDVQICVASDEILDEARVSSEGTGNNADHDALGSNSGGACNSFVFDVSCDKSQEAGGGASDACRPENLQRKAKLLVMQDEVCKRYKQYHQQIQMVVSSFESVAGLNAATPYMSLALKMIAKHFRCLKDAITDQLKSIKNALRNEFSSPSAGTSGNKGNASVLKFFDQSFQKQEGAGNLGILEGQHIWRPQRGLPERAVSILRAWLFNHFLHPYPTDTDKHMLATQTGLTRNQVSNWFINARVRVWKPMVEEIHMLETKGSENARKTGNGKTALEACDQADDSSQYLNQLRMRAIPDKQVGCSSLGPPGQEADRSKASRWNQEKRSRIEYHVPDGVDGSLMGFVPSHRSGVEMGGIGSVSLTLGLTQSPEGGQRPPMQQERHLRHYGGQIIRDFVG